MCRNLAHEFQHVEMEDDAPATWEAIVDEAATVQALIGGGMTGDMARRTVSITFARVQGQLGSARFILGVPRARADVDAAAARYSRMGEEARGSGRQGRTWGASGTTQTEEDDILLAGILLSPSIALRSSRGSSDGTGMPTPGGGPGNSSSSSSSSSGGSGSGSGSGSQGREQGRGQWRQEQQRQQQKWQW